MATRKAFKYFLFVFCAALSFSKTIAQPFSYVYIQGDKETPFYVKLEDQMQPRYGKNYCIISQLAAGIINVQILFQQNVYPPQRFTIIVPDNGYRGFLLTRKGNTFSLFDIQQQFYLPAGNSAEDDHMPTGNANSYIATIQAPAQSDNTINTNPIPNNNTVSTNQPDKPAWTSTAPDQPKFIDNIQLDNERTVKPADNERAVKSAAAMVPAIPVNANDDLENNRSAPKATITNSDCPEPMGNDEYEALCKKVTDKSEETRLKYLLGKMNNCYTTVQIRTLTKTLSNDPERYAFLKQAYSRVTDQANFNSLINLLSTQEWKSYFRLITP